MQNIKIATWNMAYWTHKDLLDTAWEYVLEEVQPDILLFQEGRPPKQLPIREEGLLWSEIGGSRDWGSGIYCPDFKVRPEFIEKSFRGHGALMLGSVSLPDRDKPLTCVSIYGLMEKVKGTGYAMTNLHRMLSDLTGLFHKERPGGYRDVVLVGDLNASTQWDEKYSGSLILSSSSV